MTGLECELECTVIEIISCHGWRVPGADCRGHMGRECSVILTHQMRPLNLSRFQLLCRMQLNLFLISASAKEQISLPDFNLTQAGPASARKLFSTNIQSSYSHFYSSIFLFLFFIIASLPMLGRVPLPWGELPSSFPNGCTVSVTPFC